MPWDLTGNAGTQSATDFLGTTDNNPIVFRTNGTERVRVSNNGLEVQEARTYLLGVDGGGNHWIMAGGTAESRDNALGFNRAANAIIVNDGWDMQFSGADCAENFESVEVEGIEPGTVVVVADEERMEPCTAAYDKRVAGVVSGAEGLRAGLLLNRSESKACVPVALIGKVYCNVDANFARVEVGDLLTTSPTVGHAMKAEDSARRFGTTLGKALRPLDAGRSRIPVLVALQ